MEDEVRIGVIGAGAMGQGHLSVWEGIQGARVTAVCDPLPDRAEDTATRYGAAGFSELESMLDSGLVDAVDICTPSGLHGDQALAAAQRNLHVLCEKPLDLRIEKVDRLIAECDARGMRLGCVFQRRTYPGARAVADAVHQGKMGRILSASVYVKWWRAQSYYDSADWRGTRAMDGGVLANQAIHALDHLCWLAGPVAEVEYARLETACHAMESEDLAIAVLRFESGARGVVEATTCCSPDLCSRLEIFGTGGSALFDDAVVVRFGLDGEDRLSTIDQTDERMGGRSDPMAISLRGHEIILSDFAAAIRENREPLIPGREARLSVDALDQIYRKAGVDTSA